ncbi:MAG: Clp protease N-terminal domain-containing protein [Solirubrobacteraceae bacterium]
MFERFTSEARAAVQRADDEARALGSRTVEAEHLLLAVSDTVGVDHDDLVEALEAELAASLSTVGVRAEAPSPRPNGVKPKFGTSAKVALHGALANAMEIRDRRIGPEHIARGVLMAEYGTVPRTLDRAGIDRFALLHRR